MAEKPTGVEEELHQEEHGRNRQLRNELLIEVYRKLHKLVINSGDMSGAIDWLFEKEVINEDESTDLQDQYSKKGKARKLMSILHSKRNCDAFVELTAALIDEKNWIVVDVMKLYNKLVDEESTRLPPMDSLTLKRSDWCFFIVSLMGDKNRKVLDVRGNCKKPGTEVITYARKTPTASNQLWYKDENGIIRSKLNDFALDSSSKDGLIRLQPFVDSKHQQWILTQNQFKNLSGDTQALEARVKSSYSKYANLLVSAYHGGCSQLWEIDSDVEDSGCC